MPFTKSNVPKGFKSGVAVVSHDNGKTWHRDDYIGPCDGCKKEIFEGGEKFSLLIIGVDHKHGIITAKAFGTK